ncbi:MAG: glutathione S-transferase [Rhodospirillales bacterium]|nr:glutathione S-transferase [Rhodospirillales bacterium]
MIDLYTYGTGNGQRASVALEESGLPYRAHKVDLAKGEHKKPEFLKINPHGAIPVLVDSDGPGGKPVTVAQSSGILLYAADKSGKFIPKDPLRRAAAFQWFAQAVSDVGPASGVLFALKGAPDQSAKNIEYFESRLVAQMANADRRLGEVEYLAEELSIADLALYPAVAVRKALLDKQSGLTNLKKWLDRMAARPGVAKGMQVPG